MAKKNQGGKPEICKACPKVRCTTVNLVDCPLAHEWNRRLANEGLPAPDSKFDKEKKGPQFLPWDESLEKIHEAPTGPSLPVGKDIYELLTGPSLPVGKDIYEAPAGPSLPVDDDTHEAPTGPSLPVGKPVEQPIEVVGPGDLKSALGGVQRVDMIDEGDFQKMKRKYIDKVFERGSERDKRLFVKFLRCMRLQRVAELKKCSIQNVSKLFKKKIRHIIQPYQQGQKGPASLSRLSADFSIADFQDPFTIADLCEAINEDSYELDMKNDSGTISWLNELIALPDFYHKAAAKKDMEFSPEIQKLMTRVEKGWKEEASNPSQDLQNDTKRLHRLMLRKIYPDLAPPLIDMGEPRRFKELFDLMESHHREKR